MASSGGGETAARLSPDEAFNALGNETRIKILQILSEAGGPLSFSELRTRLDFRHGGQFSYHLHQLVDHFVEKSGDGYELRPAGRRVIEAVLSGAVTERRISERRQIDERCQLCGAPIEIRYAEEHMVAFCTACSGIWGKDEQGEAGYLGRRFLPPAGLRNRSLEGSYRAAWTWTQLMIFAMGCGMCPACSAPIEHSIQACENHEVADGLCERCGRRYAEVVFYQCTNCIFEQASTLPVSVSANGEFLRFLLSHNLNPLHPPSVGAVQRVFSDFDEEIFCIDPFEARVTFSIDGESISLVVDDSLEVVEITRDCR